MSDLTPAELDKVRSILKREPNETETGIFTVMWSEHCSYKSSRLHLRKLPTKGKTRSARAGRERGHHRYRRRLGHRVQNRVAQSPEFYRTVSRRGDRRRRNPARHFHDGRAADRGDGCAALRAARRSRTRRAKSQDSRRRGQRNLALRELFRRADGRRRDAFSSLATTAILW